MSATIVRKRYELVRCSNLQCIREYVREANGRLTLPCGECHCEMLVLPFRVEAEDGAPELGSFDLAEMRRTLGYAIGRERDLAAHAAGTDIDRAWHRGRSAAFGEALEMLTLLDSSASDPLRTGEDSES